MIQLLCVPVSFCQEILGLSEALHVPGAGVAAEHLFVLPAEIQRRGAGVYRAAFQEAAGKMAFIAHRMMTAFGGPALTAPDEIRMVGRVLVAASAEEKQALLKNSDQSVPETAPRPPTFQAFIAANPGSVGPA